MDSSVLLDVLNPSEQWHPWAVQTLRAATGGKTFVINPLIYAEVSVGYRRQQDLDAAVPAERVLREPL